MKKLGSYIRKLKNSYRANKRTFAFYIILRALVVLTLIRSLLTQNFESVATCILVLMLFLIPAFLSDIMDLTIPPLFQAFIFGFIFAAEILGEVNHYYVRIPGWDTILHTLNGFLFCSRRLFTDLSAQQEQQALQSDSCLSGTRCFLLFDDDRCSLGVF